jgi:hypothetical protein
MPPGESQAGRSRKNNNSGTPRKKPGGSESHIGVADGPMGVFSKARIRLNAEGGLTTTTLEASRTLSPSTTS